MMVEGDRLMYRFKYLMMISALYLSQMLCAVSTSGEEEVRQAWYYWSENKKELAEKQFKEALTKNETNVRAYLGLSYLYQLQHQYLTSWHHFQQATAYVTDTSPYIISAILTPKWTNSIENDASGILDLLKGLAKDSTLEGYTRAMANERLGEFYQSHNDLARAQKHFDAMQSIDTWMLIGPFDNISASGFDNVFPPERAFNPDKEIEGKNGILTSWFPVSKIRLDHWIDFQRYFAENNAVFYGNTFVHSPEKQTAQIRVGTSGSLKIFLNDELLYAYFDENNNDLDTYIVETELQKGWNRLLIKCGYSELNRCNFLVRITDTRGNPLNNIKTSYKLQKYTNKPGAPATEVANFAERFFQEQIQSFPTRIENYLLLTDCYLKNDKAIEAEMILLQALEHSPENALIYTHLLEAYLRGEKYDEISTTYEKIYTLDPTIPAALDYKFEHYLSNNNYAQAEEILNQLLNIIPESADSYHYRLQFYSKKNINEKIIEISREGYHKFPDDWQLVTTEMTLAYVKTKSYEQPIEILENYTKKHTTGAALNTLANVYLKAGNIERWEKTFQQLLQFYPASAGYYYQMAETYASMQIYDKASEYLQKAISICPGSPLYWFKLGEIKRAINDNDQAKIFFQKALALKPTYYEARDNIRELQGEKSIFTQFPSANIDQLIATAPTLEKYPEDNAVYLLNDLHRVVYKQGASETEQEILIRVFNGEGIDDLHTYWIPYNSNTEQLIIEKAVVIKPDKSEILGDISNNQIVFKALENNDFIYIKYKMRNYYAGKLSNHFWDEFLFSRFYPVELNRYALLVPKEFDFFYKSQFMSEDPASVSQTADGIRYIWRITDQPAITSEYGMPALADIGKMIYVSSIKAWSYIVNWYLDLAATKTRSSYEIKKKVSEITGNENCRTDLDKIQCIYDFITTNVRYSSVPFRQSALIPQKARDVLVSKIGDCKDMVTLCIAMLNEVGINAYYVLVNTRDEGLNKHILPTIAFNHTIIAVELQDTTLFLDLTAQNYPIGSIPIMDMGAFALLIKKGITKPFYLSSDFFKRSAIKRETIIALSEDDAIRSTVKTTRTYRLAAGFRNRYRYKGKNEQYKVLTEVLTRDYPNVILENFNVKDLDSNDSELTYDYTFKAPDYIGTAGTFKIMRIPWTDNETALKALSYETRRFPYAIRTGTDTLFENITIELPDTLVPVELPLPVNLSCDHAEYTMILNFNNGRITGLRQMIYNNHEIEPNQYAAFKTFFNQVVKTDTQQILLKMK
jgi:tetratricopeptide (TPR) repeat protein